ncbi:hypothetical protein [Falsiroseomonas ponticola]|uniref:hypothetical protein n=1 Tax=Falsiroseomonas ponticola TaxID=2786951 RepID=UPI00193263B7|nr:hypothetical protein [Roseomonas ponticola]
MAIFWTIKEGEGIRIDGTDIWMINRIIDGGGAAEVATPFGDIIILEENAVFRVGPGFRMWLERGDLDGHVRLAMEHYVPLMHRHPPRNHKISQSSKGPKQ